MEALTQSVSVAAVLVLLVAALWWLRRRGIVTVLPRRHTCHRLESMERLPLGPQHSLHLIRCGEQALLVSCGPGGCGLIAARPWRELAAPAEERA